MRGPSRPSLAGESFDVAIIGGGINGVAIARECATAHMRTLVVEQSDFCAGTTSRSTRIIHGGLRYLEQGELGLVRESLQERQRLLAERPHLVHRLNFILALPHSKSHRSSLEIRAGLWVYRRLAGSSVLASTNRDDLYALERHLDAGEQWTLFSYDDAQCEFPERLVAEWLLDAVEAGAVARNHCAALAVTIRDGQSRGLRLRDLLTGAEETVSATWIVNASGPWADRVATAAGVQTDTPMLTGVRGSHLVLKRFADAPDSAVYSVAVDGRPIFLVPWNGQLLFGTTEVRDSGDPSHVTPDDTEAEYLLQSLQRLLPKAGITPDDVAHAFAGIRPLPFAEDHKSFGTISRRHIIHDHAPEGAAGMLSVISGKLTTAASLARECIRKLGFEISEPEIPVISVAPKDGIDSNFDHWAEVVAERAEIPVATARAIATWHCRRALSIAMLAKADPILREPLCEHTAHITAEAVDAVLNQFAVTLGDILLRRVPVALGACWSEECSRNAAARIGAALGWSTYETRLRLEEFEEERARFLRKPTFASSHVPTKRAG